MPEPLDGHDGGFTTVQVGGVVHDDFVATDGTGVLFETDGSPQWSPPIGSW